jgi:hypothetical protein
LKAFQDVGLGADEADVDGFSDGPIDTPILKTYGDHVACQLWDEVVMYCPDSCSCVCFQNNF